MAFSSNHHHLNFSPDSWVPPPAFPWYHVPRECLIPGVPDEVTTLVTPMVLYWIISLAFHLLDISGWEWLEKHRVQPSADILKKNLATKGQVVAAVMKIQLMQTSLGYTLGYFFNEHQVLPDYPAELQNMSAVIVRCLASVVGEARTLQIFSRHGSLMTYYVYWWGVPLIQLAFAMFVLDTYQYFVHRALHEIPYLYKHLHSVHHRLYIPYAYGSQFNHPIEGAIVDGLSVVLAALLAGLSERQAVVLFSIATYKGIEDHCGYQFPWHPLRLLTSNNTEFHEIHHQPGGLKSNFSQPLFVFWDRVMGTYMTMEQFEAKRGRKMKTT